MTGLEAELMEALNRLSVEFGPRPVGSPGNRAAGEAIRAVLAGCGLETRLQEYPVPDWELAETRLVLDGVPLRAAANPFSPACDLEAPVRACATLDELRAACLEGSIAVLHGEVVKQGLTPPYAVYSFGPDPVAQLLIEKHPAAIITVHTRLGFGQPLIEDWEMPIPSATVPAESGLALVSQGGLARLRIDSRRTPSSTANVVGLLAGARPERIVLCAHYDTKHGTPGAFDNASGVAVLLSLARVFAGRRLEASLEWVAFSGEEAGGTDVRAYLEQTGELENILALVNVDGVGQRLGINSYTLMAGSQPLEALIREVLARHPGQAWVDPWYESDHSAFSFRGVPSVPVSSVGCAENSHLPGDTPEWMDAGKLAQVVDTLADLVEALQSRSLAWCREPVGPGA